MIIREQLFNNKEVNTIKNHVLATEDNIKRLGVSRYPGAGENALNIIFLSLYLYSVGQTHLEKIKV